MNLLYKNFSQTHAVVIDLLEYRIQNGTGSPLKTCSAILRKFIYLTDININISSPT